MVPLTWTN